MYRDLEQRDFARQLRNQPTEAEKRLWWFLRSEKLGVKFGRQAAIGAYIVDFVCFSHRLIVELDGPQHFEAAAQAYDPQRDAWLASRGFHVIRFRNQELDDDIWAVVKKIKMMLETPPQPSPATGRGPEWQQRGAVGRCPNGLPEMFNSACGRKK
jgi:very-short-patch-repair endonuclease